MLPPGPWVQEGRTAALVHPLFIGSLWLVSVYTGYLVGPIRPHPSIPFPYSSSSTSSSSSSSASSSLLSLLPHLSSLECVALLPGVAVAPRAHHGGGDHGAEEDDARRRARRFGGGGADGRD